MTHSATCGRCVQTDAASQFTKHAHAHAHLTAPLLSANKAPRRLPPHPCFAPLVVCAED